MLVVGGLVVWSGGWWWGCWDFLVVPLPGRLGSSVWLTCWCLCACRSEVDASRAEKLRQEIGFTEHTWPLEKVYEYYGGSPEGGLSSAQVLQNRYVAACVALVVSVVLFFWLDSTASHGVVVLVAAAEKSMAGTV